jgi:outer membrane protein OmpA-like peptidoglycan-associated protein
MLARSILPLLSLSFAPAALAQDADTFAVSGSSLDAGGTLQRHAPGLVNSTSGYAGLALTWAKDPLVFLDSESGEETVVVGSQFGTRVQGGYNINGAVRFDVEIPTYPSVVVFDENQFAMGDIRVGALVPITGTRGDAFVFGVTPFVSLPTGDAEAFVSSGSVGGGLVASAGGQSGVIDWVADVGVDLTQPATIGLTTTGSAVDVGLGGSIPLSETIRLGLELDQRLSLADSVASAGAPSEVHVYSRFGACEGIAGTFGAGTSLVSGVGSPDIRVIGMLSWSFGSCGVIDTDGDGIFDDVDQCIERREDMDGFEDDDGCPEDNDGDGVPDKKDACPMSPGPVENDGCPDRDGDGIGDAEDQCPDRPGSDMHGGCPDTDGDGFHDLIDACVDKPGGEGSTDGCPKIVVTKEAVVIMEKVLFETNQATILSASYGLLDRVAVVINENPQITRIEVQGHTDDVGPADYNVKLSQRRAEAVRRYLISKDVSADRLIAKGYGKTQPIVSGQDDRSRAKNRRVEFKILDQ